MDKIIPKRPTVLIAGGSRGIGAATARRFARGGWNVAINYHHSRRQAEALAEELAAGGVHARALSGDVSQQTEVQALVRQTQEQLGGLNALVCCAGVAPRQMLLTDLTAREWREVMEVNLHMRAVLGIGAAASALCYGLSWVIAARRLPGRDV